MKVTLKALLFYGLKRKLDPVNILLCVRRYAVSRKNRLIYRINVHIHDLNYQQFIGQSCLDYDLGTIGFIMVVNFGEWMSRYTCEWQDM